MYVGLHVKYPLFLSDFNDACIFLGRFSKNTPIPNCRTMRSVEAKLFHADGQTDMTKLTVALRNLRTCLQNQYVYIV